MTSPFQRAGQSRFNVCLMLAASSESLFDKAVFQSTPLGECLMELDLMIYVPSQEADKTLVQDALTRKTEKVLPL